jgi:hypothetical protein
MTYEDFWRGIGKMLEFDATRKQDESIDDYRDRMRRELDDVKFRSRLENQTIEQLSIYARGIRLPKH